MMLSQLLICSAGVCDCHLLCTHDKLGSTLLGTSCWLPCGFGCLLWQLQLYNLNLSLCWFLFSSTFGPYGVLAGY